MKNIVIIHYNTPELTLATIKSVRKHTPGCHFYIFDNSTKSPFIPDNTDDITIFDNTRVRPKSVSDIIDFPGMFVRHNNTPRYKKSDKPHRFSSSAQHILSVDYFFDYLDEFVLLDSDVLIKKDISGFFNSNYTTIAGKQEKPHYKPRFMPFIMYINVKKCKKYNIRFKHPYKLFLFERFDDDLFYDTGASFYEDIITSKLNYKLINTFEFVEHYGHASWKKNDADAHRKWLELNSQYYE